MLQTRKVNKTIVSLTSTGYTYLRIYNISGICTSHTALLLNLICIAVKY